MHTNKEKEHEESVDVVALSIVIIFVSIWYVLVLLARVGISLVKRAVKGKPKERKR